MWITSEIRFDIRKRTAFPGRSPSKMVHRSSVHREPAGNRLLDHPGQRVFRNGAFLLGIPTPNVWCTPANQTCRTSWGSELLVLLKRLRVKIWELDQGCKRNILRRSSIEMAWRNT